MVYVGTIEYKYGRMKMYHMASPDIEELHRMAEALGVRKWFQGKSNRPHYDICRANKREAIKLGAVEVHDRELIKICFTEIKK